MNRRSLLYVALYALELTLLLYTLYVPAHVYFFPSEWAVHVVNRPGVETMYTEPRPFVDPQPIPQVISHDSYTTPIPMWRFYTLVIGFVLVKVMRIGPRKAYRNFRTNILDAWNNITKSELED